MSITQADIEVPRPEYGYIYPYCYYCVDLVELLGAGTMHPTSILSTLLPSHESWRSLAGRKPYSPCYAANQLLDRQNLWLSRPMPARLGRAAVKPGFLVTSRRRTTLKGWQGSIKVTTQDGHGTEFSVPVKLGWVRLLGQKPVISGTMVFDEWDLLKDGTNGIDFDLRARKGGLFVNGAHQGDFTLDGGATLPNVHIRASFDWIW
jgi:hypothetical protein